MTYIKRFGGGDAEFAALIERTKYAVYGAVLSCIAGDCDVDDVVQETYIAAYYGYGALSDEQNVTAWLCGIARNLALKRAAQAKRVVTLDESRTNAAFDPERGFIRREEARELAKAVTMLPVKISETITLHYLSGLSVSQIAAKMECPAGTVKYRLHEGRCRLAVMLEREGIITMLKEEKREIDDAEITKKVLEYLALAREEMKNDRDRIAGQYCDRAFELLGENPPRDETLSHLYRIKGNSLIFGEGKRDEGMNFYRRSYEIESESGDFKRMVAAEIELACNIGNNHGDESEVAAHFSKALQIAERSGDSDLIAQACIWDAKCGANRENQYNLDRFRYALKMAEGHKDKLADDDYDYLNAPLAFTAVKAIEDFNASGLEKFWQLFITVEHWRREGKSVKLISQPGFGLYGDGKSFPETLDTDVFYASMNGSILFDEAVVSGGLLETRHQEMFNGAEYTSVTRLISRDAVVTVPAGTFTNCLQIRVESSNSTFSETFFAPKVGIVRAEQQWGEGEDDYICGVLSDYEVESRSDSDLIDTYLPLFEGNKWQYRSVSRSGRLYGENDDLKYSLTAEVCHRNGVDAMLSLHGYEAKTE